MAADDDLAIRIEHLLADAGIAVELRASAPEELDEAAEFDIALVAEDMGDVRTAAVVRRLRERAGAPHVVVLRTVVDGHAVRRALEAGADGIVTVHDLERCLVPTLMAVAVGQIAVPAAMRRQLAPPALSHRERQVLALVVEGCTNSEIAQRLFLAESTVKSHLATAFAKLGVRSRRDAAALILGGDTIGAAVLTVADSIPRPVERRFD